MPTAALRRLLHLHLEVARGLELLEPVSADDLDRFSAAPNDWDDPSFTPVNKFERAVRAAEFAFHPCWRYRCSQLGAEVQLSRLMRLVDLTYILQATGPRSRSGFKRSIAEFESLKLDFAIDYTAAAAAVAINRVATFMVNLRAEVFSYKAAPYITSVVGIHPPNDCWVAQPLASIVSATSQQYRDRLGLHHYPRGTTIGDQLVRLDFRAQLSGTPCPPSLDPELRERSPNGLWLLRPTVVNKPNVRFAQGHAKDAVAAAAPGGATVDIGSDAYHEGDAEFVLLAGLTAKLQWNDVELLPGGPPMRHARDDDHPGFSNLMHGRLKRLT